LGGSAKRRKDQEQAGRVVEAPLRVVDGVNTKNSEEKGRKVSVPGSKGEVRGPETPVKPTAKGTLTVLPKKGGSNEGDANSSQVLSRRKRRNGGGRINFGGKVLVDRQGHGTGGTNGLGNVRKRWTVTQIFCPESEMGGGGKCSSELTGMKKRKNEKLRSFTGWAPSCGNLLGVKCEVRKKARSSC